MKILLICCLHGNENYGLEVARKSELDFVIGNPFALEKNVRFIDDDLNRVFPGREDGNCEERLAFELTKKLKEYSFIIDLHSSSNICPLFGIITKPTREKVEFAKRLGLRRLVLMIENYSSGRALIDFCRCGISLEVGPHERKENVLEALNLITNFLENKNIDDELEIFEVFGVVAQKHKNIKINNFNTVRKGQVLSEDEYGQQISEEDFVPVLVSEKSYNGILCLIARKVNLKDIKFYN